MNHDESTVSVRGQLLNDLVATLYRDKATIEGLRITVRTMREAINDRVRERDEARAECAALHRWINSVLGEKFEEAA